MILINPKSNRNPNNNFIKYLDKMNHNNNRIILIKAI